MSIANSIDLYFFKFRFRNRSFVFFRTAPHVHSIRPYFWKQIAVFFFDITGGVHARLKEFRYLESFLSDDEREKLAELRGLLRSKFEFDAHYTLQYALRIWLYLHVPTSLLLLAFVIVHVFSVLYY